MVETRLGKAECKVGARNRGESQNHLKHRFSNQGSKNLVPLKVGQSVKIDMDPQRVVLEVP